MNENKKTIISVIILLLMVSFSFYKMPVSYGYPPIFSKEFPLSTPISFWAAMMGMRRLATDIVWIQANQYYGTREEKGKSTVTMKASDIRNKKAYPLLKNYWQQIIRFDPMFVTAQIVGPVTLAWNHKRFDEALELLDEGIEVANSIKEFTTNLNLRATDEKHPLIVGRGTYFEEFLWKLYTLKTIILFLEKKDYTKATELLERIAFDSKSPEELRVILAQIYEKRKLYKKSIALWLKIYEETQDTKRKESAYNNVLRMRDLAIQLK